MAFWPVRLASTLMRSLGLVAAPMLTFLFTDIEGSAARWQRLGDAHAGVLAGHRRLIRAVLAAHGGQEIDTQGDEFAAVFAPPRDGARWWCRSRRPHCCAIRCRPAYG